MNHFEESHHEIHHEANGNFLMSTDKALINIDTVHHFLSTMSTWAKGISRRTVEVSIQNSLCFAIYENTQLVAFCRVVTDRATFGNLVDVFVIPEKRGLGLSKMLMRFVMKHPVISGLRRFTLATADAHALYQQFGFNSLIKPESFMEIYKPNIYQSNIESSSTA